jgi:hypothetical protein
MPSIRGVLTDQTVDSLAEQVDVPRVPAVLLDQVADEPAQAGLATVGPADVNEMVEPAVGQGRVQPRAGPLSFRTFRVRNPGSLFDVATRQNSRRRSPRCARCQLTSARSRFVMEVVRQPASAVFPKQL